MADRERRRWTRRETALAYRLYCELPFGRLHRNNERVIQMAQMLDRSPSSVALKLVNFAHLDPEQRARGIRGMSNVSALDREITAFFTHDWDTAIDETADDWTPMEHDDEAAEHSSVATEGIGSVKIRLTQRFFRRSVLAAYDFACCLCSIPTRELLIASHIMPWATAPKERTNPKNGLALCALHDRAFDAGLLTVSPTFTMTVSSEILCHEDIPVIKAAFVALNGSSMRLPTRFVPDPKFLTYHSREIFRP